MQVPAFFLGPFDVGACWVGINMSHCTVQWPLWHVNEMNSSPIQPPPPPHTHTHTHTHCYCIDHYMALISSLAYVSLMAAIPYKPLCHCHSTRPCPSHQGTISNGSCVGGAGHYVVVLCVILSHMCYSLQIRSVSLIMSMLE